MRSRHSDDTNPIDLVRLYFLGQARAIWQTGSKQRPLRIQPKPFHLLAYLALNWEQPHRRETLCALFWPDKPPRQAANNLRQALWHLRRVLPPATARGRNALEPREAAVGGRPGF